MVSLACGGAIPKQNEFQENMNHFYCVSVPFQDHGSEPSSPNTTPENALEAAVKARRKDKEEQKGGRILTQDYLFILSESRMKSLCTKTFL